MGLEEDFEIPPEEGCFSSAFAATMVARQAPASSVEELSCFSLPRGFTPESEARTPLAPAEAADAVSATRENHGDVNDLDHAISDQRQPGHDLRFEGWPFAGMRVGAADFAVSAWPGYGSDAQVSGVAGTEFVPTCLDWAVGGPMIAVSLPLDEQLVAVTPVLVPQPMAGQMPFKKRECPMGKFWLDFGSDDELEPVGPSTMVRFLFRVPRLSRVFIRPLLPPTSRLALTFLVAAVFFLHCFVFMLASFPLSPFLSSATRRKTAVLT